uniref:Uncharacterized protein n=1 Tax=Panagrolaimus sp. JU765 TaxID=591449 RepID=A0AC34PVW5_9BILA
MTEPVVESQLDVGEMNTESLEQATMIKPHCNYTIRSETLDGPMVRMARIGEQIVHRWDCDS